MELPPRTRRILRELEHLYQCGGTTSAYAENTHALVSEQTNIWNYLRVRGEYSSKHAHQGKHWNYLRVRGEYDTSYINGRIAEELPPRTRRIPFSSCFLVTPC